ncbi:MAG: hypothetical protein COU31_02295 [Candidatus Magasanikbacteria bacterium CG10_big_fil_rev_8_21_14_0_10_40_10]|uniref:Uncharacterized protein n=1 Tax=Candidatus Magasanikbacteria bacterium CG10_big_fil_rev_8_21_14_0_10_40_10 TaxID=1974648 RepID=A0A2M6W423_9BACT|nr:MAG: hypothetical protein COU31_02295 [Candidatus Magasanikbacteria bacterium CG10_big_fil_rev_8_21_14_0_10_40_10]
MQIKQIRFYNKKNLYSYFFVAVLFFIIFFTTNICANGSSICKPFISLFQPEYILEFSFLFVAVFTFFVISIPVLAKLIDPKDREERRKFYAKYGRNFHSVKYEVKLAVYNFISVIVGAVSIVMFSYSEKNGPTFYGLDLEILGHFLLRFVTPFFIVLNFYYVIRGQASLMGSSLVNFTKRYVAQKSMVLKFINDLRSDNNLKIGNNWGIEGAYYGRQLKITDSYKTKVLLFGFNNVTRFKNIKFSLKNESLNFSLKEKKYYWGKITGVDVDDCFEQRFDLSGRQVKDLPMAFKEMVVNYQRNINISVDKGEIIFSLSFKSTGEYCSDEGLVLLLEYLSTVVDSFDK